MFNLPIKPILITSLVCISLNECAYLVVGPLEISPESVQNHSYENGRGNEAKSVPKRESKSKHKTISSAVTQSNLDDIEIIEDIPYCTNLFRSSIGTKENHEKTSDNPNKIHKKNKESNIFNNFDDNLNQNTIKNDDKNAIIENLKRELANERAKVQNLTNELKFVRKLCEDSPLSYSDYDYDSNNLNNDNIQSIQTSLDLYNLINSRNKFRTKNNKGNKDSKSSLNEKFSEKFDLINYKNASHMFSNNDRINKNLFKDNIYQIPNFAVNEHKNYNHPNVLSDLPIINPNVNYPIPMRNPNILLPYKNLNEESDILRTLYPQFFLDDQTDFNPIVNEKRASGRSWMEPEQIYANNMKQLTAPYKIFPGHTNPNLRYFNIRDKRNDNSCNKIKKIDIDRSINRRNNFVNPLNNEQKEKLLNKTKVNDSIFSKNNLTIESNETKVQSDTLLNSNDAKTSLKDRENDDDDEKIRYYESSKGSQPMKYSRDYINPRKQSEKLWYEMVKEKELTDRMSNLNKEVETPPEQDDDKSKYFDIVGMKVAHEILSKNMKSRNDIFKGRQKDLEFLNIYHKFKSAKDTNQKSIINDQIAGKDQTYFTNESLKSDDKSNKTEIIKEPLYDESESNDFVNNQDESIHHKSVSMKEKTHGYKKGELFTKQSVNEENKSTNQLNNNIELVQETLIDKSDDTSIRDDEEQINDDTNIPSSNQLSNNTNIVQLSSKETTSSMKINRVNSSKSLADDVSMADYDTTKDDLSDEIADYSSKVMENGIQNDLTEDDDSSNRKRRCKDKI